MIFNLLLCVELFYGNAMKWRQNLSLLSSLLSSRRQVSTNPLGLDAGNTQNGIVLVNAMGFLCQPKQYRISAISMEI